jgi:hypothetical protein
MTGPRKERPGNDPWTSICVTNSRSKRAYITQKPGYRGKETRFSQSGAGDYRRQRLPVAYGGAVGIRNGIIALTLGFSENYPANNSFRPLPLSDMMCLLSIASNKNLKNISPTSVNDERKGRNSEINRET